MNYELVSSLFNYDISGVLTWKVSTNTKVKVGDIVGCIDSSGYIVVRYKKKNYKAHRLIFLLINGYMPKYIDHINGINSDNRIDNLRDATLTDNQRNRKLPKNNVSGYHGVYFAKNVNKWCAVICVDYKTINLGYFIEFHEAVNARKNAEVLYGFHENHGKREVI